MGTSHSMDKIDTNLTQNIETVKHTLQGIKHPKLALGISTKESNLKQRFDQHYDDYIFLDNFNTDLSNPRTLAVDFNDIDQLRLLAIHFAGVFDLIVLDDSTFKSTNWGADHLKAFRAMLSSDGQFIFGPQPVPDVVSTDSPLFKFKPRNKHEVEKFVRDNTRLDGPVLLKSYAFPLILPIAEGAYDEEITEIINAYKEAITLEDEEAYVRYLTSKKVPRWDFNMVKLEGLPKVRQLAEKFINTLHLKRGVKHDIIIPENYQRIMADVFGKGNVLIEFDKPLPFASNSKGGKQSILITATRRDYKAVYLS
jgi:hypothetical protein